MAKQPAIQEETARPSDHPAHKGALISPQGHVLAVIAVNEASYGLNRGELRGLTHDQAVRMFERGTAIPYTSDIVQKRQLLIAQKEREMEEDTTGPEGLI